MNQIWNFIVRYKWQFIIGAILLIVTIILVMYYSETGKYTTSTGEVVYKQQGKYYVRNSQGDSKEITETEYEKAKADAKQLKK